MLLLLLLPPTCRQVVCEGRLYTRWLAARLQAAGAAFEQAHLASLDELAGRRFDVILNCSGLGARSLVPDSQCYPIRGQILRVTAPWVSQCIFAEWPDGNTSYIIPNRGCVVVGGTGQFGDSSRVASLADNDMIAARAVQVLPSLEASEVVDTWVGLRPGRTRLRLEGEPGDAASGRPPVVHAYGHGGAGLTLAWGTAGDAAQLAVQLLGMPAAV